MAMAQRMAVIITALSLERAAVLEHLQGVGEEPELRASIYRRGIFEERSEPWDVVVAEIGAGNEGLPPSPRQALATPRPTSVPGHITPGSEEHGEWSYGFLGNLGDLAVSIVTAGWSPSLPTPS